MLSIITLLTVLTLSILVTRIATVALAHTGLSKQSARFQARSAFTGVGFTTDESEKVVNHPVRRRVLLLLMLMGNAGIVTAMSSLIISFVNMEGTHPLIWRIVLLVTGLAVLWGVASSGWVDRHLSNLISRALKRYSDIDVRDYAAMLHLAGEYQVSEIQVEEGDWMANQSLSDLRLSHEGVMVLGITRKDGVYMGAPMGSTIIHPYDTVMIYGRAAAIESLDERKQGTSGDDAHAREVARQVEVQLSERETDADGGKAESSPPPDIVADG